MTRRRPLIVLAIIAILLVTPFLLRNPPLGETNSTSATTLVLDKNITFYPYLDMARGRASIEMLSRILAEAKQQLLANNLSVAGPRAGLVRGLILHGRLVNDFVLDIRGKPFYFVVLAAKHGNNSVTNSNAFLGPWVEVSIAPSRVKGGIDLVINAAHWSCGTTLLTIAKYMYGQGSSRPIAIGEMTCTDKITTVLLRMGGDYALIVLRPVNETIP